MSRLLAVSALATALLALSAVSSAGAASLNTLIAPASACSGADDASAPAAVQEQAMLCLTNFARRHDGLAELSDAGRLDRSAGLKADDILRCDSFSHEACGREFTFWMQKVGYIPTPCWRAGENIAWGTGSYGTVRSIFAAWMHSSGHRENILGSYGQIGIGLRVGGLDGYGGAHVWTQQFGLRC
jgi:uncharacterized protein YkwD